MIVGRIDRAQDFLIFLGSRKFGPPNERFRLSIQSVGDRQDCANQYPRPQGLGLGRAAAGPPPR